MKAKLKVKLMLIASVVALSSAAAAQGTSSGSAAKDAGKVVSVQPQYTQSMQKLQQSAQRLRESIQALAQKKPGPDRDQALDKAHEALLTTQRAMLSLPPELRSTGNVSTADYDASVKKLMQSADSLRQSIQEMAQQPAGEGRNRAISTAKRALLDTQMAMIQAYEPGKGNAQTMGAASSGNASGKQAVQELKEESRSVSKAAREAAVDARNKGDAPADSSKTTR